MSRPFIPVPNTASIELIYTISNQTIENCLHVKKASPYSGTDLQNLRATLNTWDQNYWYIARSNVCTLTRIRTKALDSLGSPLEDYYLPSPRAGGLAGAAYPAGVCLAVKAATGLTGRSYRGRIYVPCGNTTWQGSQPNEIAPGPASQVASYLNTLLSTLAAAGHTMVVVSYMSGGAWRATGLATPITQWTITDYHWDSQRRRLTGRGI